MSVQRKPARWSSSDEAIRAVQVAFDVEEAVLTAVRAAAFHNDLSTSDQIRQLLDLPTATRPKRPRLTVSLSAADYEVLGMRYGVPPDERLTIKEKVTAELIAFASTHKRRK
jgi:predicted exporter